MTKRRITVIVLGVLISIGATLAILSGTGILDLTDDVGENLVADFDTAVIERMDLRTFLDVVGILEYGDSVQVSANSSGVLTNIAASGSKLDRGSIVFRLYTSVSELQIAVAEAAVSTAEIGVESAQKALNAANTEPDEQDVADAQLQINLTGPILDNARRDLTLIQKDWDSSLAAAQESRDIELEDYQNVFQKWLGIVLGDDDANLDPDTLLDSWSVNLDFLFGPELRFKDISMLTQAEGPPVDNSATPWSEPIIYNWLNFYPDTLAPTCKDGTVHAQDVCIEKEMQDSWDYYQDAEDNLRTLQTQADKSFAIAERAITQADGNLAQAQDTLDALYESVGTIGIENLEKQLEVADATLQQERDDLMELTVESSAGILMFGDAPAWRGFREGMTPGEDVMQLELNLISLGYASPGSLQVDQDFDGETSAAVMRLQADLRVAETGRISFGDIIFLPGAAIVATLSSSPSLGSSVNSNTHLVSLMPVERTITQVGQDGVIFSTTESLQIVQTSIDVADQDLIEVGSEVEIELPDESVVPGIIKAIGNIAIIPQGAQAPFFEVSVAIDENDSFPQWTGALVTVSVTKALAHDVLAVPVTSLLALLGGGYALEILQPESNILVKVETGIYANGWVEVTSHSLEPGREVIVSR